jgi:multidrug resistance protein MdtO
MTARTEPTGRKSSGFFAWLSYELAPKDGRAWAVVRMATACSITVAIAMVFRIPEPTYMAYIVFLISKDEKGSTFVSAIGGQTAVTVAILATLALFLVDLSEPALRLPAMAAMTFLAMFSVRVFALGPITYLAGFVIVLLQSVVDDVPSPEQLTRITLWIWVVLFVPIVITLILNILFAPSVGVLRNREFKRIVGELSVSLRVAGIQIPLGRLRERVVELLDKKAHDETKASGLAAVNTEVLRRLLSLLVLLEAATSDTLRLRGGAWAAKLDGIQGLVDRPLPQTDQGSANDSSTRHRSIDLHPVALHPIDFAVDSTLTSISQAFAESETASKAGPVEKQLLAKDAATNPAHWQFALKTAFAVMIVYSIYTLTDWPGLRTSIVTCFFVALGSLGETVHKLTLRISGALIGGALAGLCIVFVLPHCTDIGQLCLLIAVVSAGAGWVATSSEQLAYAGLQIAFAFFLGVLQDYAPATDLTVLRDRVAGILLGNIVMTIVFSILWPQSAATRVRSAVGQVLRALGSMLESPADAAAKRERAARGLVIAEHFRTLRGFELQLVPGHVSVERIVASLRELARFEGRVFVSACSEVPAAYRDADRVALARWAGEAASAAESGLGWPKPPALPPGVSQAVQEVLEAAQRAAETVGDFAGERDRTTSHAL